MNNKKLTDTEIIKALECCGRESCFGFPYHGKCHQGNPMIKDALDLINRQQADIEKLKETIEYKDICIEACEDTKSEAVKQCLAKVKNYIKTRCNPYGKPDFDYDTSIKILNFIDNLVKEMVGENNE